jgi:hypothetical protein
VEAIERTANARSVSGMLAAAFKAKDSSSSGSDAKQRDPLDEFRAKLDPVEMVLVARLIQQFCAAALSFDHRGPFRVELAIDVTKQAADPAFACYTFFRSGSQGAVHSIAQRCLSHVNTCAAVCCSTKLECIRSRLCRDGQRGRRKQI